MVGVALDALTDGKREEKTVIVHLSDHGFHLGENERRRKRTLWEEATRVPLMIRVPLPRDPGRPWKPAIMSHLPGNRLVRSEDFRYTVYRDDSEELDDHARGLVRSAQAGAQQDQMRSHRFASPWRQPERAECTMWLTTLMHEMTGCLRSVEHRDPAPQTAA